MSPESPWRAHLSEGFVIVLSILIAFSIDALWADYQDREELDALLELLAADIQADVNELRSRVARSDSILERIDLLLAAGEGTSTGPRTEELRELVPWVFFTSQTDPSLSAYEVVSGSGAWARVPPSVKVALSEYMRGPFTVDRQQDLEALGRLVDLSASYGGLFPRALQQADSATLQRLRSFLDDPGVQAWLATRRAVVESEARWQRTWVDRLPRLADSLASLQ